MNPISSLPLARTSTFRNFMQGFPFHHTTGGADMTGSVNNPTMMIKWLPLKDLSKATPEVKDPFDDVVYNVRTNINIGDKVKALPINSLNDGIYVEGVILKLDIDHEKKTIRVMIRNAEDNSIVEIYPETIFRDKYAMTESKMHCVSFNDFCLNS